MEQKEVDTTGGLPGIDEKVKSFEEQFGELFTERAKELIAMIFTEKNKSLLLVDEELNKFSEIAMSNFDNLFEFIQALEVKHDLLDIEYHALVTLLAEKNSINLEELGSQFTALMTKVKEARKKAEEQPAET